GGRVVCFYAQRTGGGAVWRERRGVLFPAPRVSPAAILELEPQRKIFANTVSGEPLDCAGGVLNDLSADARGGVYLSVSGTGVFYANPQGVITQYGKDVAGAKGLNPGPAGEEP